MDEVTVKPRKKRASYMDDPKMLRAGPRKRPVPHPTVLAKRRAAGKQAWETRHARELVDPPPKRVGRPGETSRAGVPDGMTKAQAQEAWAVARESAKETIAKMIEQKILTDDEKANEALEAALEVMRGPMHQRDKLAAARIVLEWTKAKPAQKQEISVQKAEDWLALVTADAAKEGQ